MKKNLMFLVLMLLISSFDTYKSQNIEFHVAVDGNDNANGSLSNPFATLPKAVEDIRNLHKKANSNPATIYLRGGRHQLHQTLVLGIADGLTLPAEPTTLKEPGTAQLTFAAYPGENPVVSSGIPVMNWRLATDDLAELPASAKGKVWVADMPAGMGRFYTFYDGKGRLNRARGKGFVPTKTGDKRTLYFPAGKLKNWNNLSDVEINIRPGRAWAINMLSLESVDEQNGVAKTAVTATYELGPLAGWVHTKDANKHNEIINNHIHHFSEITWHSPGIWAWQSGYNRITNNYIHHSGYAAVLITTRVTLNVRKTGESGMTIRPNEIKPEDLTRARDGYESWLAREKYNHSRHNLVAYNEITHSVQILSDGNAIYVSGTGTGNIIRYNYIHDNLEHSFPSAIRCDDDQNGTLIFGNIIHNNYGFESQIASKGINDIINNFVLPPNVHHTGAISALNGLR